MFAINPGLSFLTILKGSEKNLRLVFILFFFVLGYSFNLDRDSGSDVTRVVAEFEEISSNLHYGINFNTFITDSNKPFELLLGFLDVIIAYFTNDYKIYLGVLGCIYGFFYTEILLFLLEKKRSFGKFLPASFLLLVVFIHSPYAFQAYRFYSGAIVAIWVFIGYFFLGVKRRIYVLLLFCFMHNGLFLVLIMFLLLPKIKLNLGLLWILVNLSFSINWISQSFDVFTVFTKVLPTSAAERAAIYEKNVSTENKPQVKQYFGQRLFSIAMEIKKYYFIFLINIVFYFMFFNEADNLKAFSFIALGFCLVFPFLGTEGYRYIEIFYEFFGLYLAGSKSLLVYLYNMRARIFLRLAEFYIVLNLVRRYSDYMSLNIFLVPPFFHGYIEKPFTVTDLYNYLFT